ncbi:hypothetical protein PRIPAC_83848 [Pristionchus pacificus]|uniref:Uncharacterized protein n=1 Tax=Pristionchus pacificus TaxID=54126 RepID=A0A2A6BP06_PRIPA|nr:hypothetical protein PRIPAC_83848 [Pristionchus pacificus]|eukprot:PDM67513.1 hypothetical protein PRIPAC_48930 [Pristionchus pacificus]
MPTLSKQCSPCQLELENQHEKEREVGGHRQNLQGIMVKGEGHESKLVGPTTTCLHPAVTTVISTAVDSVLSLN